jgi:hypothetical protein
MPANSVGSIALFCSTRNSAIANASVIIAYWLQFSAVIVQLAISAAFGGKSLA